MVWQSQGDTVTWSTAMMDNEQGTRPKTLEDSQVPDRQPILSVPHKPLHQSHSALLRPHCLGCLPPGKVWWDLCSQRPLLYVLSCCLKTLSWPLAVTVLSLVCLYPCLSPHWSYLLWTQTQGIWEIRWVEMTYSGRVTGTVELPRSVWGTGWVELPL